MKQLTKKQKTIQVQRQIKKYLKQIENRMFLTAKAEIEKLPNNSDYFLQSDNRVFDYVNRYFLT